jgi:hypothetical protein
VRPALPAPTNVERTEGYNGDHRAPSLCQASSGFVSDERRLYVRRHCPACGAACHPKAERSSPSALDEAWSR